MLPTLQLQPWREWPTLGGQRELLKAISGVRDGLRQLLLAASSLCWTSPEDGLRHRDAAVCLHLASGSPSLLHVGGHTWAPAGSPQCLGKGSSKGSVLGVLGDLPWRREQGGGSNHCYHHTQLRHSPGVCGQGLCLLYWAGDTLKMGTFSPIRLEAPRARALSTLSDRELPVGRGHVPLQTGSP